MNKKQENLTLLPNYFKKISFGLLAFTILILVLKKSSVTIFDKELMTQISKAGLLLSLTMLALTRDKEEDELTIKIRMNSFATSFLFGAIYTIILPFIYLLFGISFSLEMGSFQLILTMLFIYFFNFWSSKKRR